METRLAKNVTETVYKIDYHFFHKSSDSKKNDLIFGSNFFEMRVGFNFLLPEKYIISNIESPKTRFLKDEKIKLFGKR